MTDSSYSIFNNVGSITMGTTTIKTGPDHSQIVMNVNPYTNHGQHVSGGRMEIYGEGRRAVSEQPPKMFPESRPIHEWVESAPALVESQSPQTRPQLSRYSDEGRRAVSEQPPKVIPESRPIREWVESSPALVESQPPRTRPLPSRDSDEGRRAVSEQPPKMIPESRPIREWVESAPALVESQPSQTRPQPSRDPDDPPFDVKATNDNFVELWTDALEKHKEKTGFDIQDRKNEFVQLFEDCKDSAHALAVLERLPVFRKPVARTSWMKIKDSLKKVLDVVIVLNTLAAEVGNAALPHFGKLIFVGTGLLLKASRDITKQSEALEKLFSRLAAFLSRLEVRGRAKIQPSSKRIIIKILVELLNALAIATVMVKSKFWNKAKTIINKVLFDEDEIDKVLSRLSDLTEEESAMVLAELAASRADFTNLAKEVGGLDADIRGLASQMRSVIGIGNLDSKELIQLSSLLQSTRTEDKTEVLGVLKLLKIENNGTQTTLSRIEADLQELRNSLARDRSSANAQASHEISRDGDHSASGRMQDAYENYANYGQHVTGGKVEIREPQTTAPPVSFGSRQPERPTPMSAGTSRDTYGPYANYGQHVTKGDVLIYRPKMSMNVQPEP